MATLFPLQTRPGQVREGLQEPASSGGLRGPAAAPGEVVPQGPALQADEEAPREPAGPMSILPGSTVVQTPCCVQTFKCKSETRVFLQN